MRLNQPTDNLGKTIWFFKGQYLRNKNTSIFMPSFFVRTTCIFTFAILKTSRVEAVLTTLEEVARYTLKGQLWSCILYFWPPLKQTKHEQSSSSPYFERKKHRTLHCLSLIHIPSLLTPTSNSEDHCSHSLETLNWAQSTSKALLQLPRGTRYILYSLPALNKLTGHAITILSDS